MCRASEINQALMANMGWRMLNVKESLWSMTLLNKYGSGREGFNVFPHKQGASHIWQGISAKFPCVGIDRDWE